MTDVTDTTEGKTEDRVNGSLNYDLRGVFDERIKPLLDQIFDIVKETGMPMVCAFQTFNTEDEEGLLKMNHMASTDGTFREASPYLVASMKLLHLRDTPSSISMTEATMLQHSKEFVDMVAGKTTDEAELAQANARTSEDGGEGGALGQIQDVINRLAAQAEAQGGFEADGGEEE